MAATRRSGKITQGDWKIISEEMWTIKDTNERKA